MATTTLTSQQLQQLANSRGQLFSSALQTALRGVAVNAQGQRTTTQLIARPAPASSAIVTGATAVAAVGSSPGQSVHTAAVLRPQQQQSSQQRQPHTATIALQRPIGVGVVSTGSGTVAPTLTATSSQQLASGTVASGNTTPIALAVANQQQANVTVANVTRGGIVTPHGTLRTVVTGTTAGTPNVGGQQIVMTQASGQSATSTSATINSGSPTVQTTNTPRQQIVVATTPGQVNSSNTSATGSVTPLSSSGVVPSVTRQIVVSHASGNNTANTAGLRSGQILQVTGQGGQQHQIVVSQSGQIILNPSVAPKTQ